MAGAEPTELEAPGAGPLAELSRRTFLNLSGATLALWSQALVGCTRAPAEKIVPYRVDAAGIIPGRALHYASAHTLGGYATGIIVESHEGRPTKVEGNPDHPESLGATSAIEQALVMELFDPRRLRAPTLNGAPLAGAEVERVLTSAGDPAQRGRGVHLVLSPFSSPLLTDQVTRLRARLPELAVHFHAPLSRAAAFRGARLAWGSTLEARADLQRASVIVAIDADFLARGPEHLARTVAFAAGRRVRTRSDAMNRLYVIETAMSVTGGMADHRLALLQSEIPAFVATLLREVALALGSSAASGENLASRLALQANAMRAHAPFIAALARELVAQRGRAAILAGDHLPPSAQAGVHALNALLNNEALSYVPSSVYDCDDDSFGSLVGLRAALAEGAVETLLVFDTDVVHASAAALDLRRLFARAKQSIYFGLFANATSAACQFCAPAAHVLESWLDTRSLSGTTSIVQPLIAPLYGGLTLSQVLARLLGDGQSSAHDLLKAFWREKTPGTEFQALWETTLQRGVLLGSGLAPSAAPALSWSWLSELAPSPPPAGIELNLVPDARLGDGRFGNHPWLLELPCAVTKQAWGNAAWLAPALARKLHVENGDILELTCNGHSLEAPALIVPGHALNALTLSLGWGNRALTGGESFGADGYRLLASETSEPQLVRVRLTGKREELALTQDTTSLGDSPSSILQWSTLSNFRDGARPREKTPLSLYTGDAPKSPRQWGMTIDLSSCTGCSACVIACQAENNVPSVGKSGVLERRQMHWLRIDRYLAGSDTSPQVLLEPMACQHCEKAPCEYVCPTGATVHSTDGLNQMVYNRCVGTRFCSNNCPYKVRRFNWFNYHAGDPSPRELAQNPEVTVRARGVMEKCTYCVQRIRKAEIGAKTGEEPLTEQPVRTACQQVCPARAIQFGDVNDPRSEVALLRKSERAFQVLPELGAVPRTRYLMKLNNPNPELT